MAYQKRAAKQQVDFIGYVDITLEGNAQKEYKKWRESQPAIWDLLDEYAENGYRVSVAWDEYNKTYQCSITTNDPKNENAGYVLVGRGSTSYNAMTQAIYKDSVVAQNNWKAFTRTRSQDWD